MIRTRYRGKGGNDKRLLVELRKDANTHIHKELKDWTEVMMMKGKERES